MFQVFWLSRSRPAGLLLAGFVLSTPAGARECWAEFFDQANFQGNRLRLDGPVELPSLRNLQGRDWSGRIESLKVGADAAVTAYRQPGFQQEARPPTNHPHAFQSWGAEDLPAYQEQEISFGPGKSEHHLGELNFHRNIQSLKINCRD